ncbi:MAG: SurA N-terminal domain-containing protein [Gammaproteobacteria bacterium]
MLQSIRDHTQGWIAGVIISMLILSFALWGIHSYLVSGGNNLTVAKVNGTEISKSQLAVAYERLHRQLQMQYSSSYQLPEQAETELKNRALQTLINIQVLKQASLNQDYRVSERQIDSFLEAMPEFQVNGQFSAARFQQILETTLYNAGDFLELIKTSLLIDQPRLGMIFTSFALPGEILGSIALVNQERDLQYIVLPFSAIAKQPIQITQDKVQSYYQQHQDEFKTPEQVSVDYIELSLKDLMSAITPSDDVLKKFYTENSSSYAEPIQLQLESIVIPLSATANAEELKQAQTKMEEVYKQANAGKDFATLIKELSLKSDDNVHGWMPINKVPAEMQKAVSSLSKPNQISQPIRTLKGVEIVKLIAQKEPVVSPFAQVKDKVKTAYIRQQAEEKFADMREKLANLTYEHPESLEPAAKALGLTVKTSELFTKDKGGANLSASNKVREAAFSNDVLNLQNNSDVIQVSGDDAVVIRVKTHTLANLLPLKTVENQIIDKLKEAQIEALTAQQAKDIATKLQSGTSQDQILQQYKLSWNQLGYIGRRANKINSAILETAFAMPKPQGDKKITFTTTKVPDGYAVIGLKGVRAGTNVDHKQYQVFAEQIQNTQGLMEYELYKQSLMQQAKIETNL